MDDEEIIKQFIQLQNELRPVESIGVAAIRLYRMAEKNTLLGGVAKAGWTCKPDENWKHEIEQARASERESVLYDVKSELLAWANQITESQDTIGIQNFAGYLMVKLEKKKED